MSDERVAPWAVALVALVLAVAEIAPVYAHYTWINRDGRFYANVDASLVEHRSFVQDEFAASWYGGTLGWNRELDGGWSNVALGADGHRYPKHPWLLPVLALPLYYALGLTGTLVFNLLGLALAGMAAYRFARAYAPAAPAALAAIALLFATAIREYAYDFHVDVLLLCVITSAAAAAVARRGVAVGLLVGIGTLLRPTTLAFALPAALLLAERRAWRELGRALGAGAVPLLIGAGVNWVLFGRPWWTGYNRILVVVHGEPSILSHVDSFSVPLRDGLRRSWEGTYGLRTRFTAFVLALPGLVVLVRRRPLTALAAIGLGVGFLLLFSTYEYEGDRFQWPTFVLLLPALATTFTLVDRALRRVLRDRTPVVAGLAGATLVPLTLPLHGGLEALSIERGLIVERALVLGLVATVVALVARRLVSPAIAAACALAPVLAMQTRDVLTGGVTGIVYYTAGAALVSAPLAAWLGRRVAREAARLRDPRRFVRVGRAVAAVGVLLLLCAPVGVARLGRDRAAPFHLASESTVRHLDVFAGDVPCDFLAWEHYGWECSHIDSGLYGTVGLALPDRVLVGGELSSLLVVPSAPWGRERRVIVPALPAARRLYLIWAVPDGLPGGVHVSVRVDGRERDAFDVPMSDYGARHWRTISLPGRRSRLELVVTAPQGWGGRALVALDATLAR